MPGLPHRRVHTLLSYLTRPVCCIVTKNGSDSPRSWYTARRVSLFDFLECCLYHRRPRRQGRSRVWPLRHRSRSPRYATGAAALQRCLKGAVMLDYDPLEGYRNPQAYDAEDEGYVEDRPLTEQWARKLGGPLLDLACGTGTMAVHLAKLGYQVTYVFPQEMEALLFYNGWHIYACYGDWQQGPLTATSRLMICICQRRI